MEKKITLKDYTHKNVRITDLRLVLAHPAPFGLAVKIEGEDDVLFINYNIFNARVKSYFLGKGLEEISREDLLALKWNFIITEGFYYKIGKGPDKGKFIVEKGKPGKKYVSVLEIAGPLGEFDYLFGKEAEIIEEETII